LLQTLKRLPCAWTETKALQINKQEQEKNEIKVTKILIEMPE